MGKQRRSLSLDSVLGAIGGSRVARRSGLEGGQVRPSAVLAPLYEDGGEVHVVLTRRSQHLRAHRGEVSFPGGRHDAGDADLWDTALRESWEEIGLDPQTVTNLGELDHLQTVTSRSFIVPFVGLLPARPTLVANAAEVEAILYVPLRDLLAEGVYREERWGLAPLERPIIFFELPGDTVWGATGAMLRNLLAIVTGTAN